MVKLYIKYIKAGKKTIDEVPKLYNEKVRAELLREYEAGEITEEEYKQYIGE